MDGTYQGTASMISLGTAAAGLSGTSTNPITIRALNDGGVLIDGQGGRLPLFLRGNQWWVIEGVNVANSSGDVVGIYPGSHNNTFRRVCAWNAGTNNNHVWQLWNANMNTFEDICGFGNGRTILTEFSDNGTSFGNTFRRFWARWDGYSANPSGGPYAVAQNIYLSTGNLLNENVIYIWGGGGFTPDLACTDGVSPAPTECIKVIANAGQGFNNRADGYPSGFRLLGSLIYGYASASKKPEVGWLDAVNGGRATLQDLVVLDTGFNYPIGPVYASCISSSNCPNAFINRLTTVRMSNSSTIGAAWSTSGFNEATSLAGRNTFDTGTSEASLCYRYINGGRTATPLWPWPMDDRIKAALAAGGATALGGSAGTGYAAGTVTSEVVSKLGAIPAACKTR